MDNDDDDGDDESQSYQCAFCKEEFTEWSKRMECELSHYTTEGKKEEQRANRHRVLKKVMQAAGKNDAEDRSNLALRAVTLVGFTNIRRKHVSFA